METIHVSADFTAAIGKIKPMHSVNNGPASLRGSSNADYFADAAIPFARTHDANFAPQYGAPHTVDIISIFPDFDADENDPASYDFHLTDEYMEKIMSTGAQVFYRLGNKIEHESKRYGALPPKDFHKWARICEHIIRHMKEGWADGNHYGMTYWEIWNEPDLHPQCWDGPNELFFELYEIAARHLKACFPDLKIGGPAVTSVNNKGFLIAFFDYITRDKENPVPMDFFSFHRYTTTPEDLAKHADEARRLCDEYGYTEAETILNEWNYVKNWHPREDMLYSYRTIPSLKGSAFILSCMIACQHSTLDHLMYYDARINTGWNGLALSTGGVCGMIAEPDLSPLAGTDVIRISMGEDYGISFVLKTWVKPGQERLWCSVETVCGFVVTDADRVAPLTFANTSDAGTGAAVDPSGD